MSWKWKNFEPEEVLSSDGMRLMKQGIFPMNGYALDKLQSFRDFLDTPIVCNTTELRLRGFRSPLENQSIYDFPRFSFHIAGIAFDIHAPKMSLDDLYDAADHYGWSGIGIYESFIHIDDRYGENARWRGRAR